MIVGPDITTGFDVYPLRSKANVRLIFTCAYTASSSIAVGSVYVGNTDANCGIWSGSIRTNGVAISDSSTTVPPNNYYIRIYY